LRGGRHPAYAGSARHGEEEARLSRTGRVLAAAGAILLAMAAFGIRYWRPHNISRVQRDPY